MSPRLSKSTNPRYTMTPEEFEENARIITGDPTWSLDDDVTVEEVAQPPLANPLKPVIL
ncbi:hypothetical protein Syn7803US42_57 [Synechococcus phage ACG-2014f]|uniref:Uncharacterized protein n=1 Tax=Synechococcus phage ACG-2014f TaxID=1493511 RepID=A0A0E3FQA0_9CAUD|nr:hypothetical protein Syn7803US42_57 [Synechococcus phage ACG-2014f]